MHQWNVKPWVIWLKDKGDPRVIPVRPRERAMKAKGGAVKCKGNGIGSGIDLRSGQALT